MDTRIQIGEKVRIMYDEPKWECGEWYDRKEDGEIIEIHKDYFVVKTDSELEVEYYNNNLKEKTRYGYGRIWFTSSPNVHLESIYQRLDRIEEQLNKENPKEKYAYYKVNNNKIKKSEVYDYLLDVLNINDTKNPLLKAIEAVCEKYDLYYSDDLAKRVCSQDCNVKKILSTYISNLNLCQYKWKRYSKISD